MLFRSVMSNLSIPACAAAGGGGEVRPTDLGIGMGLVFLLWEISTIPHGKRGVRCLRVAYVRGLRVGFEIHTE